TQRAAQNRILAPYMTLEPDRILPHNHPPFEALLLAPLMHLPYALLYALWVLLAALAVGASLWLLASALPVPAPARWALIVVACSFNPLHRALWSGQTSPLVL